MVTAWRKFRGPKNSNAHWETDVRRVNTLRPGVERARKCPDDDQERVNGGPTISVRGVDERKETCVVRICEELTAFI